MRLHIFNRSPTSWRCSLNGMGIYQTGSVRRLSSCILGKCKNRYQSDISASSALKSVFCNVNGTLSPSLWHYTTIKTKSGSTRERLKTFQSGYCHQLTFVPSQRPFRVLLAAVGVCSSNVDPQSSPPQGLLHLSCDTNFPTIYNLPFATVQVGKAGVLLKISALISLYFPGQKQQKAVFSLSQLVINS